MELIQYHTHDGIARITLNRPDKYNSFTRQMAMELLAALDQAADDQPIRAIVITGAGKAFSAGQDLQEATDPDGPGLKTIIHDGYNPIILKIRLLEKPVIAAVNGVAAGAGANIALACDITVAKSSASFIQAFSKIGLIPDSGGTFILPRLIGIQKATALMMTGEKISATDAERWGMIYKVYDDSTFDQNVASLAAQLAQMPTRGLALTKHALNASYTHTLEEQLKLEEKTQIVAGHTDDYKEGVSAFIEKRTPVFTGK